MKPRIALKADELALLAIKQASEHYHLTKQQIERDGMVFDSVLKEWMVRDEPVATTTEK